MIDLDGSNYHARRFPVDAKNSYHYMLVRLLIGTLVVEKRGERFRQDFDFGSVPPVEQNLIPSSAVSSYLRQIGYVGSSSSFIKKTTGRNRPLVKDLLSEFVNYFEQSNRGSHIASFVSIYRIVERLSYSAPLLYASNSKDYLGTFSLLKKLFLNQDDGELAFFKRFINSGDFLDETILDITYDVTFSSKYGNEKKYYDALVRLAGDSLSAQNSVTHQISFEFRKSIPICIILRNRFFHFATGDGKGNLSLSEIGDADEFFACMNPALLSCAARIALKLIEHDATR
jgi:hypothetical protein